jgi:hypothetical protein
MIGIVCSERGEFDWAAHHLDQALTFAQALGDPRWEAYARSTSQWWPKDVDCATTRAETSNNPWPCSSKPVTGKEPVKPGN